MIENFFLALILKLANSYGYNKSSRVRICILWYVNIFFIIIALSNKIRNVLMIFLKFLDDLCKTNSISRTTNFWNKVYVLYHSLGFRAVIHSLLTSWVWQYTMCLLPYLYKNRSQNVTRRIFKISNARHHYTMSKAGRLHNVTQRLL